MTTATLARPEARPMPIPTIPNTEVPPIPPHLLRRVWQSVVLDYAYSLFRVYREGWNTTPRAHTSYGVPQEAPRPAGSGSVRVFVERAVLWFGLECTAGEDRTVTSSRYGEALRSLSGTDQALIASWLQLGDTPRHMSRPTQDAFAQLATASGLGVSIRQGRSERRVGIVELLEPSAPPTPLNARVRRRV